MIRRAGICGGQRADAPFIRDQSRRRADIGGLKPKRIIRSGRDRAEIGVRPASRSITIVIPVDRAAPAKFVVVAGARVAMCTESKSERIDEEAGPVWRANL